MTQMSFIIIAKPTNGEDDVKVFAGWGFKKAIWVKLLDFNPTVVMFSSAQLAMQQEAIIAIEGDAPEGYEASVVHIRWSIPALGLV